MQISLRSQLIAGTAAIVGASAIAMTPVVAQHATLPAVQIPSAASLEVSLAGYDSPLTELLNTAIVSTSYLLNPADPNAWQYSGIGPVLQAALSNPLPFSSANSLNTYKYLGVLPQTIGDALPILRQLGVNGAETLTNILGNALTDGVTASEALWNLPGALVTAAQQAIGGNITGAVATLQAAIVDPIVAIGQNIYNVGTSIVNQEVQRFQNLANSLPGLVTLNVGAVVGGATVLANKALAIATQVVNALGSLNVEGAWNAAVDGLLGPTGLPGTILNLTIGAGVQTGPITTPADIPANFVPSIRTAIQTTVRTIATDLATTPPGPVKSAAAKPVAAKSVAATVAAQEPSSAVEAPSATAGGGSSTAGDNNTGGSSNGGSSGGGSSHSGTGHSKRG